MTIELIMAFMVAFVLSSVIGLFLIPFLRRVKAGSSQKKDGPAWHSGKAGTPIMGGLMFIAAITLTCITVGFKPLLEGEWAHVFVLLFGLVFGAIGFLDDYEKLKRKKGLGLSAKMKFLLQLAAAICFLFLLRNAGYLTPNLYVPFWNVSIPVPEPVYFVFAAFVIVGAVNAVNLTDGIDGLATGTCMPIFVCFAAIACCWGLEFTGQAVFSAGMTGALLGFLIYNFNPAKVFMGDTGSLFLGGAIAGMAFALDCPLVLVPLCIMPIVETLSVMIQVLYFKITHGKRVFRMAPFHHHLEMGGWTGHKWKEKELFVLFTSITAVMALISLLGVTGRYSF